MKNVKFLFVYEFYGRQGRTRTFKTPKGNWVTASDATNYVLPADLLSIHFPPY